MKKRDKALKKAAALLELRRSISQLTSLEHDLIKELQKICPHEYENLSAYCQICDRWCGEK